MSTLEVLSQCQSLGVEISAVNGVLRVQGNTKALTPELVSTIKAQKPQILAYLNQEQQEKTEQKPLAVTGTQRNIWLDSQVNESSSAYNMIAAYQLTGKLNLDAVNKAMDILLLRHETLRTQFSNINGEPHRIIAHSANANIVLEDLSTASNNNEATENLIERESHYDFDLAHDVMCRLVIAQLDRAQQHHLLIFNIHHLACDGLSVANLVNEFSELYNATTQGRTAQLTQLQSSFSDYVTQRNARPQTTEYQNDLAFFADYLQDAPEQHGLILDSKRAQAVSVAGCLSQTLPTADYARVKQLATQARVSEFLLFNTLFMAFIARFSGQDDVVVGTPYAGRSDSKTEALIGCFVNMMPMRYRSDDSASLISAVQQQKDDFYAVLSHAEVELTDVVKHIDAPRIANVAPIFQIIFSQQDQSSLALPLDGLTVTPQNIDPAITKYDISMRVETFENQAQLQLEFDASLFNRQTMVYMLDAFVSYMQFALAAPEQPLTTIALISDQQANKIIGAYNRPAVNYPAESSLFDLFKQQVEQNPNNIAISLTQGQLNYGELDIKARRHACWLLENGVTKGDLVGIAVPRSIEHIYLLLACTAIGAVYVPIDVGYPMSRIEQMVSATQLRFIVAQSDKFEELDAKVLRLDQQAIDNYRAIDAQDSSLCGTDSLYIMFTSGSTGTPKPIEISHQNVTRLVKNTDYAQMNEQMVTLFSSSPSFDASTFELWAPLLNGGRLVCVPNEAQSLSDLKNYVIKQKVNVLWATVGLFHNFVDYQPDIFSQLKQVITGGDVVSLAKARKIIEQYPHLRFTAGYGPTENTTFTTTYTYKASDALELSMPIGYPINNSRVYVLDSQGAQVPVGMVGELYTSGAGVAKGYYLRPDLTAERFVDCPYDDTPDSKMYRTGDLVRLHPAGYIEFIGRADKQVKIRGFRVELAEIDRVAEQSDSIVKAHTVANKQRQQINLYVESANDDNQADAIKQQLESFLASHLPSYMMPTSITVMEQLPLTKNHKIDTKALPQPQLTDKSIKTPPQSEIEQQVWQQWVELFGHDNIGMDDNFFTLGGHSIDATRLISKLEQQHQLKIPLKVLFEQATPRALVSYIETVGQAPTTTKPAAKAITQTRFDLTDLQHRIWLTCEKDSNNAYTIPAAFDIDGQLNIPLLEQAMTRVLKDHEALRARLVREGDHVIQVITPAQPFKLNVESISKAQKAGHIAQFVADPIDTLSESLFRFELLEIEPTQHVLLLNVHHIISDGWSLNLLAKDLMTHYASLVEHGCDASIEVPSYRQYLTELPAQADIAKQEQQSLTFWRQRLADKPLYTALPRDYIARRDIEPIAGNVNLTLDSQLVEQLKQYCQQRQVTPFAALIGIFGILLRRLGNSESAVLGYAHARRQGVVEESLIGSFADTAICVVDQAKELSFADLLLQMKDSLMNESAERVSFERLVRAMNISGGLPYNPIFQVFFNYVNLPFVDYNISGAKVTPINSEMQGAKFDLSLYVRETANSLTLCGHFDANLFKADTIKVILSQYSHLLADVMAAPDKPINQIALRSTYDPVCLPNRHTAMQHALPMALPEQLELSMLRYSDHAAIKTSDNEVSYQQLAEIVAKVHQLLQQHNVQSGEVVAIYGQKSERMIAAMLACWRIGAAFMLVDASYPQKKVQDCINAGQPVLCLLCDSYNKHGEPLHLPTEVKVKAQSISNKALSKVTVTTTSDSQVIVNHDDLAYISFTSGTTGIPKVIRGGHGSLALFAQYFIEHHELHVDDHHSSLCGIGHDPFQREVFLPLLTGGSIVIPDEQIICPAELSAWFAANQITIANVTPSLLDILCDSTYRLELPELRNIFLVGEALSYNQVKALPKLTPHAAVYNLYGTTETHWALAAHRVDLIHVEKLAKKCDVVPVGRGIHGVQLLVEDENGLATGVGEIGQLVIRTSHASLGYTDAAENAAKFRHKHINGVPVIEYLTGDHGYCNADGQVVCLGRADRQIKINGIRIELEEINHHLRNHPQIAQAETVLTKAAAGAYLVSFIVPFKTTDFCTDAITTMMRERLPEVSVPRRYITLDALPINKNFKVDHQQLHQMLEDLDEEAQFEAPQTGNEQAVAEILAQVLQLPIEKIGRHSSFFKLGGHSIHAVQVVSRIRSQLEVHLPVQTVFQHPTVVELAELVASGDVDDGYHLQWVDESEVDHQAVPLTYLQRKFYMQQTILGDKSGLSIPLAIEFIGKLDTNALHRALEQAMQVHQALRFSVKMGEDNQPIGKIHSQLTIDLPIHQTTESEVMTLVEAEWAKMVPLDAEPLFRVALFETEQRAVMTFVIHHMICDGWSASVLIQTIQQCYLEQSENLQNQSSVSFGQYQVTQTQRQQQAQVELDKAYWQEIFEALPSRVEFNSDLKHQHTYAGRYQIALDSDLHQELDQYAVEHGMTVFNLLNTAFAYCVSRWSSQQDFALGMPVHGRDDHTAEQIVGCLISTNLLRVSINKDDTFASLSDRLWQRMLQSIDKQIVPHEVAAQALNYRSESPDGNWYNVIISHQNTPKSRFEVPDLTINQLFGAKINAKVDLTFTLIEDQGHYEFDFIYNADVFTQGAMSAFVEQFIRLLHHGIAKPDTLLAFSDTEKVGHGTILSRNPAPFIAPTFAELYDKVASEQPNKVCAVFEKDELTFSQLMDKANRLSNYLIDLGVKTGDRVGVLLDRSTSMLSALIGVLNAGACYVPLDPNYPKDRLQFIATDAGIDKVLCQQQHLAVLDGLNLTVLPWEQVQKQSAKLPTARKAMLVHPTNLAYIMYTSGTTGKPKGVCITHQGLLNHIHAAKEVFGLESTDRMLQMNTINFDISVEEIFPTLAAGGCVVFLPDVQALSPQSLRAVTLDYGVTVLNFATALWRALLLNHDEKIIEHLRCVIVGGEEIKSADLAKWDKLNQSNIRLYNTYGPTETTVFCSYWIYDAEYQKNNQGKVPIGSPVPGYQLYILDENQNLCAPGCTGELYVSGPGVARGYNNRVDQTVATFLPDIHSPDAGRMYRTGDLVRLNDAGDIVYLGRKDNLVKVNGFRIELAEIETAAIATGLASQAVATTHKVGEIVQLLLYVVTDNEQAAQVRQQLKQTLPQFMMPHHVIAIEEVPLTNNKKIDFKSLPTPQAVEQVNRQASNMSDAAKLVHQAWEQTLPGIAFNEHSNFYDLGGSSLQLIQLHKLLCKAFNTEFDVVDVFRYATIDEFLTHVVVDINLSEDKPVSQKKRTVDSEQSLDARAARRRQSLGERKRRRNK